MGKGFRFFLGLISIACVAACASPTSRFRTALTGDDPEAIARIATSGGEKVRGQSCSHWLLFIPLTGAASIEDAYDDALSRAPAGSNALTDVLVEDYSPVLTGLYNQACYRVSGNGGRLR